jgi:ribosomal subunit interface protein
MDIKIHSAVTIDKNFEDYVKEKFEKLRKFIFDEGTAELHIKKEGPLYTSEIKIHSKRFNIFLKEQDNDLNKSVEILLDRTRRQARKLHDRVVDRPYK